ncbi:unnamed protein product, partial [Polarella glacialis]
PEYGVLCEDAVMESMAGVKLSHLLGTEPYDAHEGPLEEHELGAEERGRSGKRCLSNFANFIHISSASESPVRNRDPSSPHQMSHCMSLPCLAPLSPCGLSSAALSRCGLSSTMLVKGCARSPLGGAHVSLTRRPVDKGVGRQMA